MSIRRRQRSGSGITIDHSVHQPPARRDYALQVRVYYQDTDAGGIVYHARYLDYMERARTEWLRGLGVDLSRLATDHRRMFVASSISIDYLKPARLDNMLTVSAMPEKVARTYIDLNQNIFHESMNVTRARVRIACIDTATMKPSAMPREVTTRIILMESSA